MGVALRQCPALPPTIAERIKDYRAQNVADWVMYRKALAAAAEELGWAVHWYDAKKVFDAASEALRIEDLDATSSTLGGPSGRPGARITRSRWQRRSSRPARAREIGSTSGRGRKSVGPARQHAVGIDSFSPSG